MKNVMQEDQKGCKNVLYIRAEVEQRTAARTKHEAEEEDTGIRPAGRENEGNKERNNAKRTKQASKATSVIATAFALPPLNSTKANKNLPLTVRFRAIVAHVPLISRTGTLPHDLPSCVFHTLVHIIRSIRYCA